MEVSLKLPQENEAVSWQFDRSLEVVSQQFQRHTIKILERYAHVSYETASKCLQTTLQTTSTSDVVLMKLP